MRALQITGTIAALWDDTRYRVKARLGMVSPPIPLPYRGYIANGHVRFGGRVIEDEGSVDAPVSRSRWTNLKHSIRRYETDEIRDATIEWSTPGLSALRLPINKASSMSTSQSIMFQKARPGSVSIFC